MNRLWMVLFRGNALGYVMQTPIAERHLRIRSELISSIIFKLSGRAAEEIAFNDSSTGAQKDLETASELATKMVWDYGMSEELGPLSIGKKETDTLGFTQRISPDMISKADTAVKRIIDETYTKAKEILMKHREDLDNLASYLIGREVFETAELDERLGTSVA